MVGSIMNLISGTHHSYERREHAFMVLREYTIISLSKNIVIMVALMIYQYVWSGHLTDEEFSYTSLITFNLTLIVGRSFLKFTKSSSAMSMRL